MSSHKNERACYLFLAMLVILDRQNETKPSTKQAIFHTKAEFNPNDLYVYTAWRELDMASKFLEEIRRHMRMREYSLKTEKAYLYWI